MDPLDPSYMSFTRNSGLRPWHFRADPRERVLRNILYAAMIVASLLVIVLSLLAMSAA